MDDLVNIIRLIRTENIGPKTFWNLLNHFSSLSQALSYIEQKLSSKNNIKICSIEAAEAEIKKCNLQDIKMLSYIDDDFPKLLRTIDDAPPILFCKGDTSLLNKECVSIVGSRNASLNGLRFAYKIAKELAENGKVIVSGFARGIDTAAHKASINYGTIAVFAGGLDHIYPPENKDLYRDIQDKGLLVAELPLGTIPKAQNFPQRNRIISGLSSSLAVIEASLKSGSLITAKLALEQNREIFAVPGFPLDPHYQGNNLLLKQGAYLLERAEDIEEIISTKLVRDSSYFEEKSEFKNYKYNEEILEKELTQIKAEIINLVGVTPSSIDDLIEEIKISPSAVITALIELELAGKIIRHFGNKVSVKY